jgi:hypothetical protein
VHVHYAYLCRASLEMPHYLEAELVHLSLNEFF